jgi:hypothetical protein
MAAFTASRSPPICEPNCLQFEIAVEAPPPGIQSVNLAAARALALAASSSRFFGGAVVASEFSNLPAAPATSSTAAANAASFAFDGLVNPLIFLTNCSDEARISSSVTGGSKLKRFLMLRHMQILCRKFKAHGRDLGAEGPGINLKICHSPRTESGPTLSTGSLHAVPRGPAP